MAESVWSAYGQAHEFTALDEIERTWPQAQKGERTYAGRQLRRFPLVRLKQRAGDLRVARPLL